MKTDKKPIIGFICVMLSCVLVIGLTLGLLLYANRVDAAGSALALERGYTFKYQYGVSSCGPNFVGKMACKSQKNTFNIDNVTLTISYGAVGAKNGPEVTLNVPEFDICFQSDQYDYDKDMYPSIYHIKTVKEQFFSEKYDVNMVDDYANGVYYYEFNHSEEITIPKELFTEKNGQLTLVISGTNDVERNPYDYDYMCLCKLYINYKLQGTDKVVLS